jgi:hypothetical protein
MFRELLARLLPKRRPFHRWARQATHASTHEPLCHIMLGEIYHAHAAIHGPNKLLPGDAMPYQPERLRVSDTGSDSTLV